MITIARKSDVTIDLTVTGIPQGTTVTKCYLAVKTTDDETDLSGLVVQAIPVGNVCSFNITDAQTSNLSTGHYAISAKAILNDGRAVRLVLDDSIVQVIGAGVEAIS